MLGAAVAFISGGVVSTTVTVTLSLAVFPAMSVAFNVTTWVPKLNVYVSTASVALVLVASTTSFSLHVKLNRVEQISVAVPLRITCVPA